MGEKYVKKKLLVVSRNVLGLRNSIAALSHSVALI
jgi:hypothetical protein